MTRVRYYKLVDQDVVPIYGEDDFLVWARAFEKRESRIVKQEWVGGQFISTVFLGLNHNYDDDGPPMVFETMIFHGPHNQEYQERCSTYAQALQMHADTVAMLLKEMPLWRWICAKLLILYWMRIGDRMHRWLIMRRLRRASFSLRKSRGER